MHEVFKIKYSKLIPKGSSKMRTKLQGPYLYKFSNSRQIERCRGLKGSTNATIEQVSKAKKNSMD